MSPPKTTRDVRKSIQGRVVAMDYDLRILELWEAAEAQGIDSGGGGSFGLDTRLFTAAQNSEWRHDRRRFVTYDASGTFHIQYYNYFCYPNGSTINLDPTLEAVHPER